MKKKKKFFKEKLTPANHDAGDLRARDNARNFSETPPLAQKETQQPPLTISHRRLPKGFAFPDPRSLLQGQRWRDKSEVSEREHHEKAFLDVEKETGERVRYE